MFEILNSTLVLFRRFHTIKGSEVFSFPRLCIFRPGVDAELS